MWHARILIISLLILSYLCSLSLAQDGQDLKKFIDDEDDDDDEDGGFFLKQEEVIDIPTSEPPNSPFLCPYPLPPRNIRGAPEEQNIWPYGFALVHYPKLYDLCSGLSTFPNAGCLCLAPGYSSAMDCSAPPADDDIFDSLVLEYCWSRCFCKVNGKPYDLPPDEPRKPLPARPFTWTELPVSSFSDGEHRRAWVNQGFGGWRVLEERGRPKARIETVVIPPDRDIIIPPPLPAQLLLRRPPPRHHRRPRPRLPLSPPSSPATIAEAEAVKEGDGFCSAKATCTSFEALNGGCGGPGCRCFFDELSAPWFGRGSCGGALLSAAAAKGLVGGAASAAGLGGRDLSQQHQQQQDGREDSLLGGVCACNATFVARACCAATALAVASSSEYGSGGGGGGFVVYEGEEGAEKRGELVFADL